MVIGVRDTVKESPRSAVFSAFEHGPAMHGLDGEEEAASYSQRRAGTCSSLSLIIVLTSVQNCATGLAADGRVPKTLVEEMVPLLADSAVSCVP
jgi:hypothetical protein